MLSPQALQDAHAVLDEANAKIAQLRQVEPYLIDLSLRENPVGSRVGQTLAEKLAILPRLRAFGFKHISLGTLDYAMPDDLEVDDDFMMYLHNNGIDMTGCFAFTAVGAVAQDGTFTPDPSMLKLQSYGVPNTVLEIYLGPTYVKTPADLQTLRRSLVASIAWVIEHIRGDAGGRPKVFINIVDGCDAFSSALDAVCDVLSLLAEQPIEGVTFEDDRGTFLPFQMGAFVKIARSFLPPPLKLLVHLHSGAGFENAAMMEALLNGADGAWGGLPKRAAMIGHASLGELIANLVRVDNTHVQQTYQVDQLWSLATRLQVLDEEGPVPEDLPILGSNAYRLSLSSFAQVPGQFMDLPPEAIGRAGYSYRICPVVSDPPVIAGRLAEVTGRPAEVFPLGLTQEMIRLMREDLRSGIRIVYDEPTHLLELLARAAVNCRWSFDPALDTRGEDSPLASL
jgi:hypothetical protein